MSESNTDLYVFGKDVPRTERWNRFDEVFLNQPLEILCKAARRQDEAFKGFITSLLKDRWMRPLLFKVDHEHLRSGQFDFVYDRKTGLIFRSLASGHDVTMSILQQIHTGNVSDLDDVLERAISDDDICETAYLSQGMGAYMSSIDVQLREKRLRCSHRFEETMTPMELDTFRDFKFYRH